MKSNKLIGRAERWLFARNGLMILLVAIATLEATTLVQYYFSRKGIKEEATNRALSELEATELRITDILDQVETAVRSNVWSIRKDLETPDDLWAVTYRIVADNPMIMGSAIALKPDYYPSKGYYFAPYSYSDGNRIISLQLGSETYDYPTKEWYTKPLELGSGYWSEPYYDTGGGEALMTTFSMPVQDWDGNDIGVVTADVSLNWMTDLVGNVQVYPTAFNVMVSRSGQFMVCPSKALIMNKTIQQVASTFEDSLAVRSVTRAMLSGERGSHIVHYKDTVEHVFYAPLPRTGWSMATIVPHEEIYGNVQRINRLIRVLQLVGLLLLGFIIFFSARSQLRLREVSEKKNRIENELHVAREIQLSMIPKVFPPYPDRSDIDIAASIIPAKEVGGDLYDFYIHDEKLYFCIGDVSGKGVPASLLMAVTRSLFRTVSAHEKSPGRIVSSINESMSETNDRNMFVTFFAGVLDLGTGHLRYCNAGHNFPLITGPDNAVRCMEVIPNLPLGVASDFHFVEQEMELARGETLFLYTDGLTEAENAGQELFGNERMIRTARKTGNQHAEDQMRAMILAVHDHVGTAKQSDDLTMLFLRYLGSDADPSNLERHLILHNDIQQIPQLADFVEAVSREACLDQSLSLNLNLALEEAVTNVILYAYPEKTDGLVEIEAIIRPDRLDFIISDSGKPFNPLQVPPPDLSLPVEERPVGGLGIYLVNTIMDHVSYAREDGKNILSLNKLLKKNH